MEDETTSMHAAKDRTQTNNSGDVKSMKNTEDKSLSSSEEGEFNGQNEAPDNISIHSDKVESCRDESPFQAQPESTPKEDFLDDVGKPEIGDSEPRIVCDNDVHSHTENKLEDNDESETMLSSKIKDCSTQNSLGQLQVNNSTSNDSPGDLTSKEAAVTTEEPATTAGSSLSSSVSSPATTSAASAAPEAITDKSVYHVKWINGSQIDRIVKEGASSAKESNSSSQSTKTAIVTQNENGPCPLLSIVNVLLLRRKLTLPEGCEVISAEQLLEYIGGVIVDSVPSDIGDSRRLDYEQNVQDAIAILPQLQTGIDVNVRFTGVSDFEYTKECIIFDLLNISLYHGWLLDPQEEDVATAIHSLTYNQLVERIIDNKNSTDQELVTQSLIASQFLEDNGSQLTYHGLCELNATLKDGESAVLFRNNHFSVMLKRRDELFVLVTDQGYLKEPNVVWETLSSVDGAGHYVDHRFVTFTPSASSIPEAIEAKEDSSVLSNMASEKNILVNNQSSTQGSSSSSGAVAPDKPGDSLHINPTTNQIDQDLLLAMTLAEEENQYERGAGNEHSTQLTDEELAQRLQAEENRAAHQAQEQNERVRGNQSLTPANNPVQPTASSSSRQVERHESQRNKNCTIL